MAISIHTPHAGSDQVKFLQEAFVRISIHTPHAGSDGRGGRTQNSRGHFNPHSPCGERRGMGVIPYDVKQISIHTPHAGSDIRAIYPAMH